MALGGAHTSIVIQREWPCYQTRRYRNATSKCLYMYMRIYERAYASLVLRRICNIRPNSIEWRPTFTPACFEAWTRPSSLSPQCTATGKYPDLNIYSFDRRQSRPAPLCSYSGNANGFSRYNRILDYTI